APLGVLQVLDEIRPARVRLEVRVPGRREELATRRVQRGNAGIPASRQVDGGEVEGQAEEVVSEGLGHELVDLVTYLPGDAAHDRTGRLLRGRTAACVGQRVRSEERRVGKEGRS